MTTILSDPSSGRFRCPRPGCSYTHQSAHSVIIHLVRHCVKQEPTTSEVSQPVAVAPEVTVPGAPQTEIEIVIERLDEDEGEVL